MAAMGGKLPLGDRGLLSVGGHGATMGLGETVVDRGGLKGRVVANIERNEFGPECSRSEWAYLAHGIIVMTDEAGLVHYESADELTPTS